jgi:hypothetical protein
MQHGPVLIAAMLSFIASACLAGPRPAPAVFISDGSNYRLDINIIDGKDDRDSLLELGPRLGLSSAEIVRIRRASGYVGCLSPSPSLGNGALFLDNRQILTVAHIFFERSGNRRSKCFFKNQAPGSQKIDLVLDDAHARFGANPPKPGSNNDYAVIRLPEPVEGGEPFPVDTDVPVANGDRLIVVTAHPAGMAKEVDNAVPVVQPCRVRRVPRSTAATSFYRSDCDATGSSSGGMHLSRVGDRLVFRGITITTGPWQDDSLAGAPFNEATGSVTTALGTDAAILAAGKAMARGR